MKNKLISLISSIIIMFSVACDSKPVATTKTSDYNIIVNGSKYRLIKEGYVDSEGRRFVPIYEKEGESKSYYTWNITGKQMITIAK